MSRTLVASLVLLLVSGSIQADPEILGRPESKWLAQAADGVADARRSAAFALGKLGLDAGPRVVPALTKLLADPDAAVRANAGRALGEIAVHLGRGAGPDWPICGDALIKAVADESPRVRRAALVALGSYAGLAHSALDTIRKALDDPEAEVRQNAAWALGAIGATSAVDEGLVADLCRHLTDADALVRRDAVSALADLHRFEANRERMKEVGPALTRMLRAEIDAAGKPRDAVVLATTLEKMLALRLFPGDDLGRILSPVLRGVDEELSRLAAFVLAARGGPDAELALAVLRRALRADDVTAQELAAGSLAQLGPLAEPALMDLAEALRPDRGNRVRRNVAIALGRLGAKARPALHHLIETIKAAAPTPAEQEVRLYAVEAVAQIGYPNNAEALPVLADLVKAEKDTQLRLRAVWSFLGCERLEPAWVETLTDLLGEPAATDPAGARLEAARVLAAALRDKAPLVVAEVLYEGFIDKRTFKFDGTGTKVNAGNEQGQGSTVAEKVTDPDARYLYARALGMLGKRLLDFPKKDQLKADLEAAKKEENRPKLNEEATRTLKVFEP